MGQITALIRSQIQRQYMNIVVALTPRPDHVDMLFATMFEHVQNVKDEIDNEVEKYLSLSIVTSSSFIDVMEWWTTWKDVFRTLPDGLINVPSNWAGEATDIKKALGDGATIGVATIFDQIAVEQDHWEDEVLDDEVVELMNS
ncbi:unnamed protein product [Sphagnum troendelagicum]|uniref:Uncharacterized protein n=1 Tax=Sphagnum troendelagicum TaxID=128251 RepID=A0ABP0TQ95_9BRYO